jgi:hypothetical protein
MLPAKPSMGAAPAAPVPLHAAIPLAAEALVSLAIHGPRGIHASAKEQAIQARRAVSSNAWMATSGRPAHGHSQQSLNRRRCMRAAPREMKATIEKQEKRWTFRAGNAIITIMINIVVNLGRCTTSAKPG